MRRFPYALSTLAPPRFNQFWTCGLAYSTIVVLFDGRALFLTLLTTAAAVALCTSRFLHQSRVREPCMPTAIAFDGRHLLERDGKFSAIDFGQQQMREDMVGVGQVDQVRIGVRPIKALWDDVVPLHTRTLRLVPALAETIGDESVVYSAVVHRP